MKQFGLRVLPPLITVLALGAVAACEVERAGEAGGGPTTAPGTTRASIEGEPAKPDPARRLSRAPAECRGPAPRLTSFGDYGNLAGHAPVWGGFYAAFDAAAQRYRIERDAPRTSYGWRIKALWVVSSKLEQPARIEARELRTGAALWFQVGEDGAEPAPVAVLDPATAGVPSANGGHNEFPSYVYVPQAGCYALEAHWVGGAWRLVFGLGR